MPENIRQLPDREKCIRHLSHLINARNKWRARSCSNRWNTYQTHRRTNGKLPANEKGATKSNFVTPLIIRVIPTGFEPVTHCLEGSCSIQLSYGTWNHHDRAGSMLTNNSDEPPESRHKIKVYF